jgi:MFS transporter, SP family, general alpha glucoside:H+ symporter
MIYTSCAWYLLTRIGRRRLYLVGLAIMFSILLIVGCLGIPKPSTTIAYVSVALLMLFVVTYDLTVGPVCYCLVAEIPSVRLRIKTVVLARNSYNVASLCANFLNPPIHNPLAWNLRGKGAFVWCGFCFSVLVWTFFRLPEPKGLSSGELDVLFENKVAARQFKHVNIDPFRSETLVIIEEDIPENGSDTEKGIQEKQ